MNKELTEIVFILDRSGSMSGLESDTIGGFNGMLKKQKEEEGEALVSVVLFDDQTEVLYDRVDIKKIEPMTEEQYFVRGTTALLDAIGGAIHHIKNVHKYAREEDVPGKTLFIITTDGMENASHKYTYDKVKKMVEKEKEEKKWEFIFLGANIDAIEIAGKFGVSANRAVRFESDGMGTELNYSTMSKMVSAARSAGSASAMEGIFDTGEILDEVREDYEEFKQFSAVNTDMAEASPEKKQALQGMLPQFSEREQKIATMLYGLNGESQRSYDEVAHMLSISAPRIRQIEAKICRRVRNL